MNVLTATSRTQGWRANDFCWTVEGELVFLPPIECGRGSIDDDCGCRRALAGAVSHRATTTVRVTARAELNPNTYFTLICDALEGQGYVSPRLMEEREVMEWLHDITAELIFIGRSYEAGTVLERRGDFFYARRILGQRAS